MEETKNLYGKFVGEKVLIRTYSAGVHFGKLVERAGKEALLKNARRIHFWKGAASLSQLAMEGVKDDSRISVKVNEIVLTEVIEIIPLTKAALLNLKKQGEWRVNEDGEVVNK